MIMKPKNKHNEYKSFRQGLYKTNQKPEYCESVHEIIHNKKTKKTRKPKEKQITQITQNSYNQTTKEVPNLLEQINSLNSSNINIKITKAYNNNIIIINHNDNNKDDNNDDDELLNENLFDLDFKDGDIIEKEIEKIQKPKKEELSNFDIFDYSKCLAGEIKLLLQNKRKCKSMDERKK